MYVLFVEAIRPSGANVLSVMDHLDEELAKPLGPDEDTWGTDRVAQERHRAMIGLAGPPARELTPEEVRQRVDRRRSMAGTKAEDQ